ncbi:RNP-1 like RNA-binding protein [Bacteroides coprosuis DSM 18011]|mgnify:CR=1 FL=1|uniref:RNP-1 like RNA-binding protein n=1 Tax=Bacteroides coprosuis DSM 18011 TaxID=679937 RepID=F3ZPI0_9BACE|nr:MULTISPECIES: RNA-binding protein [Bacteroides]EGJ71637.1 RNP-1 like RNA-binding protein [Bacteroides coprosuis DSM 18011]HJD91924.1 RNA-binding protein [Bacteroides coprosuis]
MNIFIGSLSFNVNDEGLAEIFEPYGAVTSARVIKDKFTNRSKGFGFVEMEDDEAATKAINELNGAEVDGRPIAVSEARPREERPARSFNNNRGGGYGGGRGNRY